MVSSTAAATLRQLVMLVFDKVVELEKHPELSATTSTSTGRPAAPLGRWIYLTSCFVGSTELPDGTTVNLPAPARDAFSLFEDLCLLANSERPNFLKLQVLPKTFALELIESALTNYHALFRQVRVDLQLSCKH